MRNLIAAVALALSAASAHAQPPAPAGLTGYLEIIEPVAPRVWVIRQAEPFHLQPIGNVTLIEQTDGLVLIDSGGSPGSGRRIVGLIKSVSPKPVKAVAITHWHGDHPLGLPAILAEWPRARVIATARTRGNLTGKSMNAYAQGAADAEKDAAFAKRIDGFIAYLNAESASSKRDPAVREGFARALPEIRRYGEDAKGMYVAAPTETFTQRLLLPDRNAPVELFHPGRANTDGDAAAWLPRQKVIVSGDVIVMPVPFGFGSYPADWQRALQALKARRPAILIPGHGAPQRDLGYVDRLEALIREVRRQVAPLAAQGLTLEETRNRIDLSAQRRRFAGDDPWLHLWFDEFWTKPFVESAWKEAKGLPIEQGEG
jgi:glyoxylase-like metal-dependent hydrolase (beta-lactamase superfamily II)